MDDNIIDKFGSFFMHLAIDGCAFALCLTVWLIIAYVLYVTMAVVTDWDPFNFDRKFGNNAGNQAEDDL